MSFWEDFCRGAEEGFSGAMSLFQGETMDEVMSEIKENLQDDDD